MKISPEGKIAYHAIVFREDGGSDYVQYDFDGSIESIKEYRPAPIMVDGYKEYCELPWYERLFTKCPLP